MGFLFVCDLWIETRDQRPETWDLSSVTCDLRPETCDLSFGPAALEVTRWISIKFEEA